MNLTLISLASALAFPLAAHANSSVPQRVWTLPAGATFEGLSERPSGRLGIYWSPDTSLPGYSFVRFSTLAANGKLLQSGEVPGQHFVGNGIAREDWNSRGQHAFLPQCDANGDDLLRLNRGGSYRVLRILPRFNINIFNPAGSRVEGLQDIRFSPDGECLYVLGNSKLWIVGAQSGRFLRVVKPRSGQRWSNENAALSPDCRTILGMRNRMMFFSTRSGRSLRGFGTKIETIGGHCGELQARVSFSQNGQYAIASMQDINDYETWVYKAGSGAILWHGRTPYSIIETARGHFFLDTPRINDKGAVTTVLRRWRDGRVGWHLKLDFGYDDAEDRPAKTVFTRGGRWIYFAQNRSVWRVEMPRFAQPETSKSRSLQ